MSHKLLQAPTYMKIYACAIYGCNSEHIWLLLNIKVYFVFQFCFPLFYSLAQRISSRYWCCINNYTLLAHVFNSSPSASRNLVLYK